MITMTTENTYMRNLNTAVDAFVSDIARRRAALVRVREQTEATIADARATLERAEAELARVDDGLEMCAQILNANTVKVIPQEVAAEKRAEVGQKLADDFGEISKKPYQTPEEVIAEARAKPPAKRKYRGTPDAKYVPSKRNGGRR